MRQTTTIFGAGLLAAGALLAACGGSGEDPSEDATSAATTTASPSPAASPAATGTPNATSTPEAPVVATRGDGLSGAPVPPPTAQSSEFDSDLVNERAGAFPPLDFPAVVSAAEATWMEDGDLVLGAVQNGAARAHPLFMMRFHHVSNDELGGDPYLVTF